MIAEASVATPTIDLGEGYRRSRHRLSELAAGLEEPDAIAVAACPGWSVHDVLAHLVAVVEDVLAGRLTRPPADEETAAQVARRRGRPTADVIAEWDAMAPPFEQFLSSTPVWPALMDVMSHEHDVRAAVGRPEERTGDELTACAHMLLQTLDVGQPLTVDCDGSVFHSDGMESAGRQLRLDTTAFEVFRFRLGRRSRSQLAAMTWSGDPADVLDRLVVFGPSPVDIEE